MKPLISRSRSGASRTSALPAVGGLAAVMALAVSTILATPGTTGALPNPGPRGGSRAVGMTGAYTSTPTITATAQITATAGVTTATPTHTPTDLPTATSTPSPRPTLPPRPAFLPVTVHDPDCVPFEHHSDIVFMLDVSRFMRNEIDGRPASDWVRDWMRDTITHIDMSRSRLALVHFNRDVTVMQHLTNDRAAMLAAIEEPPVRQNGSTRMDHALRVSRDLLLSDEATPGNSKVIFFLSHMQAKDIPWENVPGCDEDYGFECAVLTAAREVKSGPGNIQIYMLATTWYGNALLKGCASDPDKIYEMPGPVEWAKIFGEMETVRRCPFWPGAAP